MGTHDFWLVCVVAFEFWGLLVECCGCFVWIVLCSCCFDFASWVLMSVG